MNIDLEELANRLERKHSVKRMKSFLIVKTSENIKITIMRAGNLVVKGISTADEASKIFEDIIGSVS
jgi:ArsR family metal-binding transcriptional regulator